MCKPTKMFLRDIYTNKYTQIRYEFMRQIPLILNWEKIDENLYDNQWKFTNGGSFTIQSFGKLYVG